MDSSQNVNRFMVRYDRLIAHFKSIITDGAIERHHIIPLCMGGDNDKSNIVELPTKAHYIAHYLLYKAHPNNKKLQHAFAMMFVNNPYQNRKFTGTLYELSKVARSNALKGVSRPEWVKQKLRKPKSTTSNYFKPKSEEHKNNISKGQTGRSHKTGTCSKCGKVCAVFNLSRWHNDNCKVTSYALTTSTS